MKDTIDISDLSDEQKDELSIYLNLLRRSDDEPLNIQGADQ